MQPINTRRWIISGLAAGILIWILEGLASQLYYADMQAALAAHGLSMDMSFGVMAITVLRARPPDDAAPPAGGRRVPRSSPRLHAWLLANPVFGPLLREWQETRTVPVRAKVIAIGMIVLVGGSSLVFFVHHAVGRVVMATSLLAIMFWLARLPSRPAGPDPVRDP